jgi:hypothetical protein
MTDPHDQRDTSNPMFGLTRGELALCLFLFALILGAQWLPRLGERLGGRSGPRRG